MHPVSYSQKIVSHILFLQLSFSFHAFFCELYDRPLISPLVANVINLFFLFEGRTCLDIWRPQLSALGSVWAAATGCFKQSISRYSYYQRNSACCNVCVRNCNLIRFVSLYSGDFFTLVSIFGINCNWLIIKYFLIIARYPPGARG